MIELAHPHYTMNICSMSTLSTRGGLAADDGIRADTEGCLHTNAVWVIRGGAMKQAGIAAPLARHRLQWLRHDGQAELGRIAGTAFLGHPCPEQVL